MVLVRVLVTVISFVIPLSFRSISVVIPLYILCVSLVFLNFLKLFLIPPILQVSRQCPKNKKTEIQKTKVIPEVNTKKYFVDLQEEEEPKEGAAKEIQTKEEFKQHKSISKKTITATQLSNKDGKQE